MSTLNVGGLEMFVWNLARFTDPAQFDVRVICLGEAGELAARFAELNIPVEALECGSSSKGRKVLRLLRRLRQLKPDVLHTHNPAPHLIGAVAAYLTRLPVLINTKHGRNRTDLPRQITMNRMLSYISTCIVPVSDDAASVARNLERVPASKLNVIRNGIDIAAFRPAADGRQFRKKAIHVARLNLIKDQGTLLKAAKIVLAAEPDFRLDIAGDGPSAQELLVLHRELGLGEAVRFLGSRTDVCELLAASDLFVLSSISEGISLTLLEAMASQLPVVATDVGGNREVVVHGKTGLLVPAQSPADLAAAILALLSDPQQARAMGKAGRSRAESEFDVRRVVRKYESLYKDLVERPGSRSCHIRGTAAHDNGMT